jgi:hypothetical protein
MEKEVFIHFPRQLLTEYRRELIETNIHLINSYLDLAYFE